MGTTKKRSDIGFSHALVKINDAWSNKHKKIFELPILFIFHLLFITPVESDVESSKSAKIDVQNSFVT